MKMLANKGDGNYVYFDSVEEARRLFSQGLAGLLFTVAHDVKFQLEFNPAKVYAYRLIGYEMRRMADSDFRDDSKDSGEMGVGQQVTALYELVMADAPQDVKKAALPEAPPIRYTNVEPTGNDELMTLHLRYQQPEGGNAVEKEFPVKEPGCGDNIRWAGTVAGFALLLRNSPFKGKLTFDLVNQMARAMLKPDLDDDRLDFIKLTKEAIRIDEKTERR